MNFSACTSQKSDFGPHGTPFGDKKYFCLKSRVVGCQSTPFDISNKYKQKIWFKMMPTSPKLRIGVCLKAQNQFLGCFSNQKLFSHAFSFLFALFTSNGVV